MRDVIVAEIPSDLPLIIGLNGSYARREVTTGSDADLFVLTTDDTFSGAQETLSKVQSALVANGFKLAAPGGVFDKPLASASLHEVIGGMNDDNANITRRMLLLLEGECLYGDTAFAATRDEILLRYVKPTIRNEQIALFFLNDIIRYWRTICVDYEHKINDQKKAPEIRLVKLRFSRMLLYFGGVVAVAETLNMPATAKRAKLLELLSMPPHQRIEHVLGAGAQQTLELYSEFLSTIDDTATRAALSEDRGDRGPSETYENLKGKAHAFKDGLMDQLLTHYGIKHPIVSAMLF